MDDSARLQAAYPGSNAEHIAEQQALVVENWNVLQEKASKRKEQLLAAADLQKFLAHVSAVWVLLLKFGCGHSAVLDVNSYILAC